MLTKDDIVAGVFDDARQAEQAIADLYRAGFPIDKIDMVTRSQGETEGTPDFALQKNAAPSTKTRLTTSDFCLTARSLLASVGNAWAGMLCAGCQVPAAMRRTAART